MNHQKDSATDWFCIFAELRLISTASRDLVVVSIIGIAFLIIGFTGAWVNMYSSVQSPQQTMPRLLQRTSRGPHRFGLSACLDWYTFLLRQPPSHNGKLETLELTAKAICADYLAFRTHVARTITRKFDLRTGQNQLPDPC